MPPSFRAAKSPKNQSRLSATSEPSGLSKRRRLVPGLSTVAVRLCEKENVDPAIRSAKTGCPVPIMDRSLGSAGSQMATPVPVPDSKVEPASSPVQTPDEYCFTMDDDSYPSSPFADSEADDDDDDDQDDDLDDDDDDHDDDDEHGEGHDHGDDHGDGLGFGQIEQGGAKTRNEYDVDFRVFDSLDHAWSLLQAKARSITEITNVSESVALLLLPTTKWDEERVIERYLDNDRKLLDAAGVNDLDVSAECTSPSAAPRTTMATTATAAPQRVFHCFIESECLDDSFNPIKLKSSDMVFGRCGHAVCKSCYSRYLTVAISEGKTRLNCPFHTCGRVAPTEAVGLLPELVQDKYRKLVFEQYMSEARVCKWCPAPGCEQIVRCRCSEKSLGAVSPTVTCGCSHIFCFHCIRPDHRPAPCNIVSHWMKKCKDDSETANWISANTKECPKCRSTIEKNGGCNHMTCRKCRYEFCWMCMGHWAEHGTSWYNCNRYEEKSGTEARDAQARSRQSLERYLHYYNRYANHEQSAKLDRDFAAVTQEKMSLVQVSSGLSWIEVQFLQDASDALQLCRQTLKWTYAFAYYLRRDNQAEIFEDNQKDLEMAVESLSRMFEQPPDQLKRMKVDMVDKIAYCTRRRHVLLEDTSIRLKTGSWQFDDKYFQNPPG